MCVSLGRLIPLIFEFLFLFFIDTEYINANVSDRNSKHFWHFTYHMNQIFPLNQV